MLLVNLDVKNGLCNGTRMKIIKIGRHSLVVEFLDGFYKGQQRGIPRIKVKRTSVDIPFSLSRLTFPVALSFAMTINKSQGQTFDKVGLYLNEDLFAHGQLYVACSRVRKAANLRIQVNSAANHGVNGETRIKNIVFPEVLSQVFNQEKIK